MLHKASSLIGAIFVPDLMFAVADSTGGGESAEGNTFIDPGAGVDTGQIIIERAPGDSSGGSTGPQTTFHHHDTKMAVRGTRAYDDTLDGHGDQQDLGDPETG